MSRPLKFRVWDKANKKFYYYNGIFNSQLNHLTTFSKNNVVPDDYNELVIQQFTGLQDKNGKDIYEGDISKPSDFGFSMEVKWDNARAAYILYNVYCVWTFPQLEPIEVIGNIFENPELPLK